MTPATEDVGRLSDADLVPPSEATGDFSYPLQRGACPFCASADVGHLVIGMPAGPDDWGSGPSWVQWVGCVHPGFDRRCESCGRTWTDEHRGSEHRGD